MHYHNRKNSHSKVIKNGIIMNDHSKTFSLNPVYIVNIKKVDCLSVAVHKCNFLEREVLFIVSQTRIAKGLKVINLTRDIFKQKD